MTERIGEIGKYSMYLIGFRKNLASHFDRSPFHLRLAFLPGWLIQSCSSVSNPRSTSLAGKPGAGERGIGQNVKPDFF